MINLLKQDLFVVTMKSKGYTFKEAHLKYLNLKAEDYLNLKLILFNLKSRDIESSISTNVSAQGATKSKDVL